MSASAGMGPPPGLRWGVGLRPTSPSGLVKNSLRKYTATWNKSNGRASGSVRFNGALSVLSWNWLRSLCQRREAQ